MRSGVCEKPQVKLGWIFMRLEHSIDRKTGPAPICNECSDSRIRRLAMRMFVADTLRSSQVAWCMLDATLPSKRERKTAVHTNALHEFGGSSLPLLQCKRIAINASFGFFKVLVQIECMLHMVDYIQYKFRFVQESCTLISIYSLTAHSACL